MSTMKSSKSLVESLIYDDPECASKCKVQGVKRSSEVVLGAFVVLLASSWIVYEIQFNNLPAPLSSEQAGEFGFSEVEALKHVQFLNDLGPHSVGSHALDRAVQYVKTIGETIRNTSHGEVEVEVEHFHAKIGVNSLDSGRFKGKTNIYADLHHVLLRISPATNALEAKENAILVSAHIDTVFAANGAGDDSSNIGLMLELARGISQKNHNFKNSIVFFFNTGEEEGLNGAHSFMTQHPWSETIRVAVDLEAMGIGGKSGIFQTGPQSFGIENFAKVAKYPTGQIISQDLFYSGAINSGTDFQVYREVGGLSGLDFAFTDQTAVYHTKNDRIELLKAGSLQHLGENMMAFLIQAATSNLPSNKTVHSKQNLKGEEDESSVYFDILGMYMIVYRKSYGKMVNTSVISLSLLILSMFLSMGGTQATISFVLSCSSLLVMWMLSLGSSILVAFILSYVAPSSVPYIKYPWLVVGLFGSPSLIGALAGQHIGFMILKLYLSTIYTEQPTLAKLEAERWLYKSGILQWLLVLIVSDYLNIGSSYIPLLWLLTPALAYGFMELMEASPTPTRSSKPLKIETLFVGLSLPIVVSVGPIIRTIGVGIFTTIRLDTNPGSASVWMINVLFGALVAAVVCLMLVHLLSYVHLSGAGKWIAGVACILFGLSMAAILCGLVPTYSDDFARPLHVIEVVDRTRSENPISYISISSLTPGPLTKEIDDIDLDGFVCGSNMSVDFVTFSVKYGCWSFDENENGWSSEDVPTLQVERDIKRDRRVTQVSLDTKSSTRWALAINTQEIQDFQLYVGDKELVSLGNKSSIDGWHKFQFAGGKESPTNFMLTLHWLQNSSFSTATDNHNPLLKLRTDVVNFTPKLEKLLNKLPSWCSLYGKSTSPYNLAFLVNLPNHF